MRLLAVVLAPVALALTPSEISQFTSGPVKCIEDTVTTHGRKLCGSVTAVASGDSLTITSNSVPSNGGQNDLEGKLYRDIFRDYCMPIIEVKSSIKVPLDPVKNAQPSCVPKVVGYALDGVQIWNQYTTVNLEETKLTGIPEGVIGADASRGILAESMDACSGRPGPNQAYHYNKLPAFGLGFDSICFADERVGKESGILGVAADGFPLYGPFDSNGVELTPEDLDECNGMTMPDGSYRYIVTQAFPHGPGCLWGTVGEEIPTDMCWFAKDWLAAMEATGQEYYRDCDVLPFPESTGKEGCLGYLNNPELFEASFGLEPWQAKYDETCGNKEWMRTFMAANPTILGSPNIGKGMEDVGVYLASAVFGCVFVGVVATKIGSRWKRDPSRESLESEYARLGADEDVDYELL